MLKKIVILIIFLSFCETSFANFKEIKKKAKVNKPEIIFPIPKNLDKCITKIRVNPETNYVTPVLEVDAPEGYGLDNRFNAALNKFENFKRPCGGGNIEACKQVKKVILEWAKADAAKRTGPSDHEGRHWNDTLTVNLWIASPMIAGYSFVKQVINVHLNMNFPKQTNLLNIRTIHPIKEGKKEIEDLKIQKHLNLHLNRLI